MHYEIDFVRVSVSLKVFTGNELCSHVFMPTINPEVWMDVGCHEGDAHYIFLSIRGSKLGEVL